LAGRQILLLLDDAGSVEQVLPLMPGTPGAVGLITSRSPLLALPAATHIALDVLTEPEAIQLLARVAGPDRVVAEPAAAVEIVRRCGLLLLAIRIAGGQIGRLYQAGFLNGCVDVDDESITWLERALVAIRAEGTPTELVACLIDLAHLLGRTGRLTEALPYGEEALAVAEAGVDRFEVGTNVVMGYWP
jgi:hypothetical protein